MSTQLSYNGIELELIKTNYIHREAIYSPDGTEYLYTHWIIDIQAIFNPGATAYGSNLQPSTDLPAATDTYIRHRLTQPRQRLVLKVGTQTMLDVDLDANNGPRPLDLKIHRIEGVKTFHVEYRIECWITDCGANNTIMLSNRWTTTDIIDEQFLTTKVTRGIAIFRSDMLEAAQQSPDHFRNQALPPIQLGFKRERIEVTVHPGINSLSYEVLDREQVTYIGDQHKKAGVTKWDGIYQQSTASNDEGGAASPLAVARVDVQVWGERNTTNWLLTIFALKIIYQKLQLDGQTTDVPVLREVAIRQHLNRRFVEMSATVMLQPSTNHKGISLLNMVQLQTDDLKIYVKDFTNPQPYDKGTRGSHKWEIVAQKLRDACSKPPGYVGLKESDNKESPNGGGNPSVDVFIGDDIPYYQSNRYSSDSYSDYRIDIKYSTDYLIVQAPVASSDETAESSIMRLAAPTSRKIVHWTAERFGDSPKIPMAEAGDPNLVLISQQVQPATPAIMPNGDSKIYRITGTYTYGMKKAIQPGEALKTGVLPWTRLQFQDGVYGNWSDEIIDNGGQSVYETGTNN